MISEITTLYDNNTWSLVLFEPSMNIVGCCWVYKIKHRASNAIDSYKTSLVNADSLDKKVLINLKPSVLLLNRLLFGLSLPLLYLTIGRLTIGRFISLMHIMSSSMVPFKRLFICKSLRVLLTLLCPLMFVTFTSPSMV